MSTPSAIYSALVTVRSLIITVVAVGISAYFILSASAQWMRIARLLFAICVLFSFLYLDWNYSNQRNKLGNVVTQQSANYKFILLVPQFSSQTFSTALKYVQQPMLSKHIEAVGKVLPVSQSLLAQIASITTGSLPYQHNVRHDYHSQEEIAQAIDYIAKFQLNPNGVRHAGVIGPKNSISYLMQGLSSDKKTCSEQLDSKILNHVFHRHPILLSLLPKQIFSFLLKDRLCELTFLTIEEELDLQLKSIGSAFRQKPIGEAWLYLSSFDNRRSIKKTANLGSAPSERPLNFASELNLANLLDIVTEQLQRWDIWPRSEIWLIGLPQSGELLGSYVKINGASATTWQNDRKAVKPPELMGQAQLGYVLKGLSLQTANSQILYSEQLTMLPQIVSKLGSAQVSAFNPAKPIPQRLTRLALAFGKRVVVCKWKEQLNMANVLSGASKFSFEILPNEFMSLEDSTNSVKSATEAITGNSAANSSTTDTADSVDTEIIESLRSTQTSSTNKALQQSSFDQGILTRVGIENKRSDCPKWASQEYKRILQEDLGLSSFASHIFISELPFEAN